MVGAEDALNARALASLSASGGRARGASSSLSAAASVVGAASGSASAARVRHHMDVGRPSVGRGTEFAFRGASGVTGFSGVGGWSALRGLDRSRPSGRNLAVLERTLVNLVRLFKYIITIIYLNV